MSQLARIGRFIRGLVIAGSLAWTLIAFSGCSTPSANPLVQVGDNNAITDVQLQQHLVQTRGAATLLEMIDTALITKAARREGLTVSDVELRARVEMAAARLGSKEKLVASLETVGRSLEDYQEACRFELLLDKLAALSGGLSDDKLQAYYDEHRGEFEHGPQVRARWMLFGDRDSAQAVRQVLEDPEADFTGLAEALSEDDVTAAQGGDMGLFGIDDYATEVTDVAFSLEPNQLSQVFEVPDGWAILQTLEKRPGGIEPFEAVRDSINARLQSETLLSSRSEWLQQARESARLRIRDPELRRRVQQLMDDRADFEPTRLPEAADLPDLSALS
ncbi:MAG: hypothetical protein GX358_05305 [candidate division WS1 bacterium]|jgi:foldase protein PrsA|nr:hypothetical protein [candidate division WS1 bacterium]